MELCERCKEVSKRKHFNIVFSDLHHKRVCSKCKKEINNE